MTPSRYDLIRFALGNWWHTDGSHCKHSSLTNKVLLLIINGDEGGSVALAGCVAGVSPSRRVKMLLGPGVGVCGGQLPGAG